MARSGICDEAISGWLGKLEDTYLMSQLRSDWEANPRKKSWDY
jgi:hypothetical protein